MRGHWEPDQKREKIKSLYFLPDLPMHDFLVARKKGDERYEYIFEQKGSRGVWYLALPDYSPKNNNRKRRSQKTRKMRLWEGMKTFPVKDPGRYSAEVFRKLCGIQGIGIKNIAPKKSTMDAEGEKGNAFEIIYRHESMPLWELARTTLRWSSNVMAELLFLAAVKKLSGEKADLPGSAAFAKKFLENKFSALDWSACALVNGSGLSYGDLISPIQLLSVLAWANGFNHDEKDFEELLPIIGWDASYGERLADPENAFRVRAKTGSMFYAISLAGYVTVKSNQKLLFVILTSDLDQIKSFMALSDTKQKEERETMKGYTWTKGARETIDALLKHWIKLY
jgi:D-alanyl-D-alanine carboxypeptidase/D-alanyl-D-alanine-endopeptidase (penicillin-binding protein 4)